MKGVLSVILCLILVKPVFSQVEITDAGLLSCLTDSYPTLIENTTELNTADAFRALSLTCNNYSIEDISLLENFGSLVELNLDNNDISDISVTYELLLLQSFSIQNNNLLREFDGSSALDLSHLTRLRTFNGTDNGIMAYPIFPTLIEEINLSGNLIEGTLDIGTYPLLEKIDLANNNIDTLIGILQLTELTELDVSRNELSFIESFENCDSLETLILEDNALTAITGLEDKEKLFTLNLNKNSLNDLSINTVAEFGSAFIQGNSLTFSDLEPLQALYVSTNGDVAYSPQSNIQLDSTVSLDEGESFEWKLDFDQGLTTNTYEWFLNGNSVQVTNSGVLQLQNVSLNDAGLYTCVVSNSSVPGLLLTVSLLTLDVNGTNSTPLAFSPGTNGNSDTFYFNEEGEIKIYDRFSNLVREEQSPFEWDGKNQNGQELPVGVYIIRIENTFWNQVSIIK